MPKEVPLAAEDAIVFDEVMAQGQGLEVAEMTIAQSFVNLHAEFIKKRTKLWRATMSKYELDPELDWHVDTGPNPEDNKLVGIEKLPK